MVNNIIQGVCYTNRLKKCYTHSAHNLCGETHLVKYRERSPPPVPRHSHYDAPLVRLALSHGGKAGMHEEHSFGRWLKQSRHALDLTQEALAEQIGCSVQTIRKIESGERRP